MTELVCDHCGNKALLGAAERRTGWTRGNVSVHGDDGNVRESKHWVACMEGCIQGAVLTVLQQGLQR